MLFFVYGGSLTAWQSITQLSASTATVSSLHGLCRDASVIFYPHLTPSFCDNYIQLILAKKKLLCYNVYIQRKRENYLLKLKSGDYAVAYWNQGQFYSGFGDLYIEEEIVGIVALKDLGL